MTHRLLTVMLGVLLLAQSVAVAAATPVASPVAGDGTRWWQGTTCYEIFVRSFADSDGDGIGDLRGIVEHLDYLNDGEPGSGDDLGVGCIWLMPIMPSPSYHGYDVTDYKGIEPDYGTMDDLAVLLDEAHARDIHVIVDLPINHVSVDHPWFVDAASDPASPYRDWFIFSDTDPGYTGPWGETVWHENPYGDGYYYGVFDASMPDLDYTNPDVTAAIEEITRFWLADVGVDGFRLDAVKHLIEDGQVQENTTQTIDWLGAYGDFIREVRPDAFTVGEVNGAGTDGLLPYYPDGLDEYFQFQLAQTLVNAANFGSAGQIGPILGGTLDRLPDQRWGTFLTNHDQKRIASQLGGDVGKLRVAAMLLLSLPGTPFIYYGEEIGMPGDKPDPNLRTPMQWSAEPGGGFSTGTPWEAMQPGWETTNVAAQEDEPGSVLATYRAWGQLREAHTALQTGGFIPVESGNRSVLAFLRQDAGETLLVVINLGSEPADTLALTLPEGVSGATTDLLTGDAGPEIGADGTLALPRLDGRSGTVFEIGDGR